MPFRQGILLPLRRSFAVALGTRSFLVLVDGHDDADCVALPPLSRRACDLQAAVPRGGFRALRLQVISYPHRNVKPVRIP